MSTELKKSHAVFSPSAAERWIACPGSIKLSERCPKRTSKYADEGTAAHTLAEMCLKANKPAIDFVGKRIGTYLVTMDMADDLQVYLDHVNGIAILADSSAVEDRLDLTWIIPDCFGTADFRAYNSAVRTLYVSDLKFGKGKEVDPERNPQQMIYAIGALRSLFIELSAKDPTFTMKDMSQIVEKVVISIVQPRKFHEDGAVRSWETTPADLLFWARHVAAPSAFEALQDNAALRVCDGCQFCPAFGVYEELKDKTIVPVCKVSAQRALEVAKTDFDGPVPPKPDTLSNTELTVVLDNADMLKAWLGQVEAYAQTLLENGVALDGYKLVAKRSNRKWLEGVEAEVVEKAGQFLGEEVYEPKKIISIAVAEKALKARGISADAVLSGLWEKPDAGVVIAPASDKRPAVDPRVNGSEFLAGEGFLE